MTDHPQLQLRRRHPDDAAARRPDRPAGRHRRADRRPEHGAAVPRASPRSLNLGAYWFSDKIALKMSGAKPMSEEQAPRIYEMVRELTTAAKMPMPRLYVIPQAQPNAFATGRSPDKAAVAVTAGITQLLSPDELRGVIAHELAHIRNRDTLIQSVAATIGGAITYLGYMLMWFGGDDESPLGLIGALALVLLAPIAATIIQLAISRQREYSADATGAQISGNPESLASALLRLEEGAKATPMHVNQATECALHRQAVLRAKRPGRPVQHPPADRGAGPAPAPDAPGARLAPTARLRRGLAILSEVMEPTETETKRGRAAPT